MLGYVDHMVFRTSKPNVLIKNVPQLMRNYLTPIENLQHFDETQMSIKNLHNFEFAIKKRMLSNGSKYPGHESS
jgi:hypothetical protein